MTNRLPAVYNKLDMERAPEKDAQGQKKEEAGWYKPENASDSSEDMAPMRGRMAPASGEVVEWTASEFVAHDKSVSWYVLVAMGGFIIAAIVFLITRDIFSTAIIAILAVAFGIAGSQKPRVLQYRLDNTGITIGNKLRSYGNFKSFMLMQDGPLISITLMPLKRFMPALSIYFSLEDEQRIVEALSTHLPLQPAGNDMVEKLMRHIRF
jgi:hypothetical protein